MIELVAFQGSEGFSGLTRFIIDRKEMLYPGSRFCMADETLGTYVCPLPASYNFREGELR